MAEPPSVTGAVKAMAALPRLPATLVTDGDSGTPSGLIVTALELSLTPSALAAVTETAYCTPLTNPLRVMGDEAAKELTGTARLMAPAAGVAVAMKLVTAESPALAGGW